MVVLHYVSNDVLRSFVHDGYCRQCGFDNIYLRLVDRVDRDVRYITASRLRDFIDLVEQCLIYRPRCYVGGRSLNDLVNGRNVGNVPQSDLCFRDTVRIGYIGYMLVICGNFGRVDTRIDGIPLFLSKR